MSSVEVRVSNDAPFRSFPFSFRITFSWNRTSDRRSDLLEQHSSWEFNLSKSMGSWKKPDAPSFLQKVAFLESSPVMMNEESVLHNSKPDTFAIDKSSRMASGFALQGCGESNFWITCVDDRVLVFQPSSYDPAHGLIVIDYQDLSHDFPDSP